MYTYFRYKTHIPETVKVSVPYKVPVYYKDTNGVTHAQFQQVQIDRDLYKHELDSVAGLLKIKSKSINSINDVVTSTHLNVGNDTVIVHDTVYSFYKKNNYLNLYGKVSPNSWDLDISLTDTLHTVAYTKTRLFGPNESFIDISNTNPYVHINKGKSVSIKQYRPILTIGPYIGYEIYPNSHISAGISIQHPMIFIK